MSDFLISGHLDCNCVILNFFKELGKGVVNAPPPKRKITKRKGSRVSRREKKEK